MRAFVVVDLGFGDSGKGTITDWLCREHDAGWVVRYNGGAQAGHNVVRHAPMKPIGDGTLGGARVTRIGHETQAHTFAQFGSGTFAGASTYLSRYMLVNPLNVFPEAENLVRLGVERPLSRLFIDADAPLTTPFHVAVNRLKELARGDDRHGSCGLGIGETVEWRDEGAIDIRAANMSDRRLRRHLRDAQAHGREKVGDILPEVRGMPQARASLDVLTNPIEVEDTAAVFRALEREAEVVHDFMFGENATVVFEGAQGVLLDQDWGFQPYTTWSRCTTANAEIMMPLAPYDPEVTRIGVTRAYATRHGRGPFPTENVDLVNDRRFVDPHNNFNPWQEHLRMGYTDLMMLRYAKRIQEFIAPLDELAVTCLDQVEDRKRWVVASGYRTGEAIWPEIPFTHSPTYEGQEALARGLERAEPIYDGIPANEIADLIGGALGLPVTVESRGPTAADKTIRAFA
jgi:adenylosuccinate synthase